MKRVAIFHRLWFMLISPFAVLILNYLINVLTQTHWGDYVAIVYFLAYGMYCVWNFLDCKEYHCVVTGPGFVLAALLMLVRDMGIFDRGFGPPYIVFALSAVIGHGLEWRYMKKTGSKFVPKSVG